jgi:hypothetical protein
VAFEGEGGEAVGEDEGDVCSGEGRVAPVRVDGWDAGICGGLEGGDGGGVEGAAEVGAAEIGAAVGRVGLEE